MNSLYEDLGVGKDSSTDDIRKAYKKKASSCHPDKPNGNTEEFKKIQKAYSILSIQDKRDEYDRTGRTNNKPSLESQASELLCNMYMSEIEKGNFVRNNYLEGISQYLYQAISTDRVTLVKMTQHLEALKYIAKHTSGNDRINVMLESKISQIKQGHEACKDHIKLLELATEMLKLCKYDGDIIQPNMGTSMFTYTTV